MSSTFSAMAFYGTYISRRSKLGKKLEAHVKYGASVKLHGVVLSVVGDWSEGKTWIAVHAPRYLSAEKEDPIKAPVMLVEDGLARAAVLDGLAQLGVSSLDLPPIGWYFAAALT